LKHFECNTQSLRAVSAGADANLEFYVCVHEQVAQNVPTLHSFVGAPEVVLPACKHNMTSKPTIGFLFTAVDPSEFEDELVAALPSTAQLIGACAYEAQAAVPTATTAETAAAASSSTATTTDSGDVSPQQQHEVVVAAEGDVALLLGSFPEVMSIAILHMLTLNCSM
jgi:hypothetical protein